MKLVRINIITKRLKQVHRYTGKVGSIGYNIKYHLLHSPLSDFLYEAASAHSMRDHLFVKLPLQVLLQMVANIRCNGRGSIQYSSIKSVDQSFR